MRRLYRCLGCLLPLVVASAAAAADDPPHKHYAVSRLPADPIFDKAPKIERYRDYLPIKADLSARMPPAGDQGDLGSGIAWAVASARSYYTGRDEKRDIARPENEVSPGFVFHAARRGGCADGANITDTVGVLQEGAPSLAAYPYKPSCDERPVAAAIEGAHDFRVRGYRVVDSSHLDDVMGQIQLGNPVVTLFRVSPAFKEFRGKAVFEERENPPSSSEEEWQPLVIVGFDIEKQAFRVMNSWGPGWGDQGFAWIACRDLAARSRGSIVLDVAASSNSDSVPPGTEKR